MPVDSKIARVVETVQWHRKKESDAPRNAGFIIDLICCLKICRHFRKIVGDVKGKILIKERMVLPSIFIDIIITTEKRRAKEIE